MSSLIIMFIVYVVAIGNTVVIIGNKKPMHPQFSWGTQVAACHNVLFADWSAGSIINDPRTLNFH